jgi:hypothetical protein
VASEEQNEEALRRQLEEELKRLKVSDVLVQTVYTVSSLGYRKLTPEDLDLPQAQLAIEALRALVPLLDDAVPAELVRDLNQVRANMQLAYAKAVADAGAEAPKQAEEEPPASDS